MAKIDTNSLINLSEEDAVWKLKMNYREYRIVSRDGVPVTDNYYQEAQYNLVIVNGRVVSVV